MARDIFRSGAEICHFCKALVRPRLHLHPNSPNLTRAFSRARGTSLYQLPRHPTTGSVAARRASSRTTVTATGLDVQDVQTHQTSSAADLELGIAHARKACGALLKLTEAAPSERAVLAALNICRHVAKLLVDQPVARTTSGAKDGSPASVLLSLDEIRSKREHNDMVRHKNDNFIEELSQLAQLVVKHAPIYITPEILTAYVDIQAALGRPDTLPDALQLYANKPVPVEGTYPIRYSSQNPDKIANAIPMAIANRALQASIDARRLGPAIDIVETTFTTKAFYRSKFMRKALLPTAAVVAAPLAAYSVATQLAAFQTTMDNATATNVAFAGILAYMGFTTSIGVVALTTANDQMDRVTWAPGVPLRERWMREDERAAVDRIAGSWGFRESWRRGDEEGEEWDTLREWIGRKGMLLDRVELMEGME